MNIYRLLFFMLLKKVNELPEKYRQEVTDDLTWWCLANFDEHGNYIGKPKAIGLPDAPNSI